MGAGVEMPVESDRPCRARWTAPRSSVRLLGPLTIRRATRLALPASRKVRALLAYLALAPHAVPRSQLCELLWDVPNDPRGELRWCLSKIRGLVDEPGRRRVDTQADTVRLDLTDCFVDAIEIARAQPGRHRDACARSGCERSRRCSPATFSKAWRSTAARPSTAGSPRSGAGSAAVTRRCWNTSSRTLRTTRSLGYLEKWLELAPFDQRVHEQLLLNALARRGRIREGEEHLAATARLFEAEGLDCAPIRDAWRPAKAQAKRSRRASELQLPLPPRQTAPGADERDTPSHLAAPRSR